MAAPTNLRIGVFLPTVVQLLDLSVIDIFAMTDPAYLSICKLPEALVAQGVSSTIHYISLPSNGPHVELSAKAVLQISKTILDVEVQPGNLDILLVPGPPPFMQFGEDVLGFVRSHAENEGTDVLSVCTGCHVLAQAGVLKGRKASGPRESVPKLRNRYPEIEWDDTRRWVQDGNIWSSGR